MKLIQEDGTMSEYIPGGMAPASDKPIVGELPGALVDPEITRSFEEINQALLPLSERNPKAVTFAKKMWKVNKWGGKQ